MLSCSFLVPPLSLLVVPVLLVLILVEFEPVILFVHIREFHTFEFQILGEFPELFSKEIFLLLLDSPSNLELILFYLLLDFNLPTAAVYLLDI